MNKIVGIRHRCDRITGISKCCSNKFSAFKWIEYRMPYIWRGIKNMKPSTQFSSYPMYNINNTSCKVTSYTLQELLSIRFQTDNRLRPNSIKVCARKRTSIKIAGD